MEIETFLALIVLGMGTARLTALLVHDDLTAPLRDFIWHWSPPEDNDELGYSYQYLRRADVEEREALLFATDALPWWQYHWTGATEARKPGFVGRVIACPLCASVWVALFNVLLFVTLPLVAIALNSWMMVSLMGVTQMGRWWR